MRFHMVEDNKQNKMHCPFCGSDQVRCSKRGYSWTYGCLGALVFNIFGLLCGYIGRDNLVCHCDECGENWNG